MDDYKNNNIKEVDVISRKHYFQLRKEIDDIKIENAPERINELENKLDNLFEKVKKNKYLLVNKNIKRNDILDKRRINRLNKLRNDIKECIYGYSMVIYNSDTNISESRINYYELSCEIDLHSIHKLITLYSPQIMFTDIIENKKKEAIDKKLSLYKDLI